MRRLARTLAGLALAAAIGAADTTPFKPGVAYATFASPGLEIHVPADQAERLRPFAARARAIYARMRGDAGWTPAGTLHVVLTDDQDGHNGFSTVIPFPLVNVQLGPTRPESTLFTGDDETVRTLVHELGHHLSNDRQVGWHGVAQSVFGRVLPTEPLSFAVFLATTPNHVLSPAFWHEGFAQWAETRYADPTSAWGGRGRDSLTHMAWRLDAARGAIAPADEWRLSYEQWPYGNRAYLYGLAYTRWLEAAFGDRRGMWQIVDAQGRLNVPFFFTSGPEGVLGADHNALIEAARGDLLAEQRRAMEGIRTRPVTAVPRRTPAGWRVAAPAWLDDRTLAFAGDAPTGVPSVHRLDAAGTSGPRSAGPGAWSLGNLRRIGDGTAVHAEAPTANDPWRRSRVVVLADGRDIAIPGERMLQPDARPAAGGWDIAAVEWLGAGDSRLVLARSASASAAAWAAIPVEGKPWSPAFRPGHDELAWVETWHDGSRLVLGGLDGGSRRVLWQVRGRILHPVWDADGGRIFCASDASGVANGWCVPLDGQPHPVTNVIGGVLAVVPSPDGRRLAVVDHDPDGPFVGVIPLEPAAWPAELPRIDLAWPAPIARRPLGPGAAPGDRPVPADPLPTVPADQPAAEPYAGLAAIRPCFWTPTLLAVPEGGLGVVGFATDPLQTHQVVASAGVGYHGRSPVGLASWTWSAHEPSVGLLAKRSELGYDRQLFASDGGTYDYVETVDTYEARVGYGLAGMERRWQAWLAAGVDRHRVVAGEADDYAGLTVAKPRPFIGDERYLEVVLAYDDSLLFPTSYARESGTSFAISARTTDGRGNVMLGLGSVSLPVWADGGHQLVLAGTLGWSDGPESLQQRFSVGGNESSGTPRGYPDTMARSRCLEAASVAYRLPVWRPFRGAGTSPWVTRQAVVEGFYDAARGGPELGQGVWYRSAGVELHLEIEYWLVRLSPGLGIARQVDWLEDTVSYFSLGFRW